MKYIVFDKEEYEKEEKNTRIRTSTYTIEDVVKFFKDSSPDKYNFFQPDWNISPVLLQVFLKFKETVDSNGSIFKQIIEEVKEQEEKKLKR